MSLPAAFATSDDYFEECMKFFRTYQYMYNFPNTNILVDNVLDRIDIESLENVDVYDKGVDLSKSEDTFLTEFFSKLERFHVARENVEVIELENKVTVPLAPKKRHEIVRLANEIAEICEGSGCKTVVDFGSGLGYLDQILFETTNFKVLGLECNESHYVGAKKRQRKYHMESLNNVKYIKHFVNENSHTNIQEYLRDKFDNHGGFCITGLHACADLSIDTINLFLKMTDAKSMVLMPCCYHKMRESSAEKYRFDNFPLSACLKGIFEKHKGFQYLRVPFLRLAAQPPCRCEERLEDSVFNLLARAVLQLYAHKHHYKLTRNKRKAVKVKINNDFTNYIQEATIGFKLTPKNENNESSTLENQSVDENSAKFVLEDLEALWRDIQQSTTFKKAAIYVLLQNHLQPVIENFVLYDRLVYLKENGVDGRFKRIFNEKISPRCLALIAKK